jgi:hypothetical protein
MYRQRRAIVMAFVEQNVDLDNNVVEYKGLIPHRYTLGRVIEYARNLSSRATRGREENKDDC